MYYIQSTGKMDIEHRLICWEQRPMSYTRNDMLDDKHFLLNLLHKASLRTGHAARNTQDLLQRRLQRVEAQLARQAVRDIAWETGYIYRIAKGG
jgi:hypothetical protein